jgi:hypothetical protein
LQSEISPFPDELYQALAPERQVVRDCLVAPLREEATGQGIGAGQIPWGRMPKSPSAITWFGRRSVPKLARPGQSRIGGTGAPHCRLFGHYVVAWVIGRDHGFFSVASHDGKVLLSDY